MNCEHVAPLLALYAGHDLDEKRSCLVAAHLQSCTQCFRAADGYARANHLLQRLDPPFFSDEVYARIRRQVLNEIERQSQTPTWSSAVLQFLAPLVQPPMSWITAALLLAISVIAIYFNINHPTRLPYNQQVADGARTAADNRSNLQLENDNHSSVTIPSGKVSDSLPPTRSGLTGKKVVNAGRRSIKRKEAAADVAQRGMLTPGTAATKPLVLQSDVDASQPSSTFAPLRVEMQTRDPNIRIIWLVSQRSQAGAKETSKSI